MDHRTQGRWSSTQENVFILLALDRYFKTYEKVTPQRGTDGVWRIKAGARVRVRVTMAAPTRRYHVALVDYLPAGFETLNPELATTEQIPEDKKQEADATSIGNTHGGNWWLWRRSWFDHQNLRDERSEAFTTLLWGGVYNYSYVARATTPGVFVVPPAKAEEMYQPETFGRSKSIG